MHAKIVGRAILIEFPSGARTLVQQIQIDCETCGEGLLQIAGHHLVAVRDLLQQTIDTNPEFCRDPKRRVEERSHFSGMTDPEKAKLN